MSFSLRSLASRLGFSAPQTRRARGDNRARRARRAPVQVECLEARVLLSPGDLDPTFGSSGLRITTFPAASAFGGTGAEAVRIQQDGKILVAGSSVKMGGGILAPGAGFVARYNSDGTLDGTFGLSGDGRVTISKLSEIHDIALAADGKILLAGAALDLVNNDREFGLVRLKADGTLDRGFAPSGRHPRVRNDVGSLMTPGSNFEDWANAIDVQVDGNIVLAGEVCKDGHCTDRDFAVVRFHPNGVLDPSFNGTGFNTFDFGGHDIAYDVKVTGNGSIVLVGGGRCPTAVQPGCGDQDFSLVRYLPNGMLDASFGGTGTVQTDFKLGAASGNEVARSVAIAPNGDVIVAGSTDKAMGGTDDAFALMRYDIFGNPLWAQTVADFPLFPGSPAPTSDQARSVKIQQDGRILAVGFSEFTLEPGVAERHFAVARYGASGALDTTFGTNGLATTDFDNASDGFGSDIGSNGKLVVAGSTADTGGINGINDFALARYQLGAIPPHCAIAAGADSNGGEAQVANCTFTPAFPTTPIYPGLDVRVALANLNSDNVPDLVTAPGPGAPHPLGVYDGTNGNPHSAYCLNGLFPYGPSYDAGIFVAAAKDLNGDTVPDIITGTDRGTGPNVKVSSGSTCAVLASFNAYTQTFLGGVRVAAGDVNGDSVPDIIVAPGPGQNLPVLVFSGASLLVTPIGLQPSQIGQQLNPYGFFTAGIFVAAGNIDGDLNADIITGPDAAAGVGPNVKAFKGADLVGVLCNFNAYEQSFYGGVRVAAANVNGGATDEIITGPGPGRPSEIGIWDCLGITQIGGPYAPFAIFLGGLFVGAAN